MFAKRLRSYSGYGFVPRVSKVVPGARFFVRAGCAVVLWLGMATGSARALDLHWSAPAECTTRDVQRARIEQLLARAGLAAIDLTVSARVTRSPLRRYRLWLQIVTGAHRAERTVQLADCQAVDQTTEALIAMAVTPAASAPPDAARGVARSSPGASSASSQKRERVRTGGARASAQGTPRDGSRSSNARADGTRESPAPRPEPSEGRDPTGSDESSARVAPSEEPSHSDDEDAREQAAVVEREQAAVVEREQAATAERERLAAERAAAVQRESEPAGSSETGVTQLGAPDVEPARWWARASLFAGAANLGLPRTQLDTGLRLGLARGAGYGELRADGLWPRSEQVEAGGNGRVRIRSFALGAAGCAAWGDRVRVGPCARISLMRSVGEVSRITARRGDQALHWCAATLSALLGVRVYELLELSIEAGIGLPLSPRPRFTVEGRGTAQTARLWSMQAVLGLGLRWEQKRTWASRNRPASPIGR